MARIEDDIMYMIRKGDYSKSILEEVYAALLKGWKW